MPLATPPVSEPVKDAQQMSWQVGEKALQLIMPSPLRSSLGASTPGPGEECEGALTAGPTPVHVCATIRGLNGSSGSWASDPSWNGSWMPVP